MRYRLRTTSAVLIAVWLAGCSTGPSRSLSERIGVAQRIDVVSERDRTLGRLAVEAADARMLDLTLTALNGITDNYLHDKTVQSCIARFDDYPSKVQLAMTYRNPKRQAEVDRLLAEQAASRR